jgi:hypothetical protein
MRPFAKNSGTHASVSIVGAMLTLAACMPTITDADFEDLNLCPSGPEPVAAVKVQPSEVTLRVGVSVPIQAALIGTDGYHVFCAPTTVWTSTDSSVATVSNGTVLGVAQGIAFVRARAGGRSDSTRVTVTSRETGVGDHRTGLALAPRWGDGAHDDRRAGFRRQRQDTRERRVGL